MIRVYERGTREMVESKSTYEPYAINLQALCNKNHRKATFQRFFYVTKYFDTCNITILGILR